MRDRLVLGERLQFEWVWKGPEPTAFEVSFNVESEAQLRELITACGEREFWRKFEPASSGSLLSLLTSTEGRRPARVWVHLYGADFEPPKPAPLPTVERLRQEAGLRALDEAMEAAALDLAGRDQPAAAGSADVELDRLGAADAG